MTGPAGPTRADFEQRLLTAPFDAELRAGYARLLLEAGDFAGARTQYELLANQQPDAAAPRVGLARALHGAGLDAEALGHYRAARDLAGFAPDAALDAATARARRAQAVPLAVVPGGRDADVVDLASARRTGVHFDDIAGLDELKRTIRLQIIEPFLRPGLFARFRKRAGGGVLLYGPPGCGKTLMARAVATECRAEFMSVGISDVLNLYIGESERNLASLFAKARQSAPCVLFFDEIDALGYSRSKANSEHTRQIVNEFLAQLDGFGTENQGVLILAATNMPWDVDAAMKRPGRFSRQVFVPPPDPAARARIVELTLADVPHEEIDAAAIAALTPHFSGADIEGLVETAKDLVLEDAITTGTERPIHQRDLLRAAKDLQPSTLDWLRTARNLVKYAGVDAGYREVEEYLKRHRLG